MMKKLFAMLLMVALCVGLVTVANAADSGSFVDSNNRQGYWALDDAGVLTISGNANIPSQSTAPYTVYRPNIKFIIIKDGVQTINTDAFSEYNALRSIIIPDSVNTIYHGIFNYCYNLVSVVYHGTEEPQKVASDFYRNAFDGLTIYVPTGYPYKDGFLEKLVNIKVSDTTPNVSFSANGGTGTMESIKTLSGATIVLPSCKFTAPNNNFKAWSVNGVEYQPGALLTVEKDTTIKAVWAKPIYSISINQPSVDGKVTVAKSTAQAGETIQMTVKMDNTDKVPVFDVRDANGNAITVTDDYTFTMPASNVTIDVEFEYCTHKKFKEQSDGTVKCVACGDLAYFKVTTKNQVVTYHTNLHNKNTGALEIVERNPGCTLTVLEDFDSTITIGFSGDFTLDLGGHTVTASTYHALNVSGSSAKVLVKNGTLIGTSSTSYGVVGVTMSTTLTLDGVIVKNNASTNRIPCITNLGVLKIVGDTRLTGDNQVISVRDEQALTDLSDANNPSGWTVENGIMDTAIPVTTDSNVASGIILGEDYVMRVDDALVNEVKSRESGIIEHKHVAAQPYTDNGNGTHNATCECGAEVTEDCVFTNSYPMGLKCICGALGKELVVIGGTEGTDYTYVNGVVTILTETPITIKNASNVEKSRHRIVINPGEGKIANVTFAGLFLDPEVYYPTVAISSGTAKISPLGTNELHPPKVEANAYGASNATIHVPGNTSLIFEGTGTLNVFGQGRAAAIGASSTSLGAAGQCGQITINNGTYNVVQNFSNGGAGIGGASNQDSFGSGSMGGITINGGTVNVVGKSWGGAAIGGGYNANGGKIIINGGTVTTEAAAIGGGCDASYGKQNTNATVSITGGTVNAEYISAKTTMEAGKMNLGRAEELIMKGGTVESIGGIARLYMYDGILNINVSERFEGMVQAGIGGGGTYRDSCKFEMYGGKVTVNAAYVGIGGYYDSDEGNAFGTIKFCGGELIVENTNTTVDSYAGIGSDRKYHSITMNIAPAKNTMITVRAGKTLNSLETLATVSAGEPLTYDSSNLTVERKAWHLTTTEVVDPDYTVSITTPNNGTVTAAVATAKAGATVTLTVTPNVGYVVDYVKYNDTTITPVTGVYSFTMPAENVAVTAIFKVCDHEGSTHTTFDNTGEKHSYICTLCSATVTEDHTFDTDTCVCGAKAVADVDGVKFGNFNDALAAWEEPTATKLTLLADVETTEVVELQSGSKVLELNGHQWSSDSNSILVNKTNLTIQDSVGTGKLLLSAQYCKVVSSVENSTLTITGGTIEVAVDKANAIDSHGTLSISGNTKIKQVCTQSTCILIGGPATISGNVQIEASRALSCEKEVDISGVTNCIDWNVRNAGGTLKMPANTALRLPDGTLVSELSKVNETATIVEHTHAAKNYADNGDETHRVTCACGEVMESRESHTYTEEERVWKCLCGEIAVADVDGVKFVNFDDAVAAWQVPTAKKLTLLANVQTSYIELTTDNGTPKVLELNGWRLELTAEKALTNHISLTIQDSSETGTGSLYSINQLAILVTNHGELNITGGTFEVTGRNASLIANKDEGTLCISGVTTLKNKTVNRTAVTAEGTVTISGDVVIEASTAIRCYGDVDVSGANNCVGWTVTNYGGTLKLPADTALKTESGDLVYGLSEETRGDYLTIVEHTHAAETYADNEDGTHKVTCACGYVLGINAPHTYTEVEERVWECPCGAKAVADVDGKKYTDFEDAVYAWRQNSAEMLTLLADVEREYKTDVGGNGALPKVLDLNGYTWRMAGDFYVLRVVSDLTIKNTAESKTGVIEQPLSHSYAINTDVGSSLKIIGNVQISAEMDINYEGAVDLIEATNCIDWYVYNSGNDSTLTLPPNTALEMYGNLVQELQCYESGTIVEHTHNYTTYGHDETNHWKVCECGATDGVVTHNYTNANNETNHWTACTCGVTTAQVAHDFKYVDNQDGKTHKVSCDCGYEKASVNHDVSTGECVCGAKVVADVDGVKFVNFADAVEAWEAPTAKKLTLLDNVEYGNVISLESDEAKTLELNGKTLTSTASANYALYTACPLTINDSSTDRTGKFVADDIKMYVVYCQGKTLTLNGGTITTNRVYFVLALNGTTTTINSDNVKLSSLYVAIKVQKSSDLIINGNGCDGWKIWNDSGNPSPIQIPNGFHLEDEAGNMLETNDKLLSEKYTVIKVDHIHNWTYAANDTADTITATCDAAGCPKPQQSMTLVAPENLVYDGTAKTVTIDGSIEGVQMPSINITGDTTNVTEEGCTATITVAGKTATLSFQIVPAFIAEATVSAEDQTYTGKAITPDEVTVILDNKNLTLNTDYTVAYADNVNVGTATITVTGKGNYTGTATGVFNIKAASIEAAQITVANQVYTGEAITPEVTIKLGEETLVKDTDYTVEYTDNINVGEATVTVNGMGNYAGTVEAKFQISKSDADVAAKSYLGETEQSAFFYGDVITVKGSAAVAQTFALRAPTDKAQLYFNGILLAEGDVSGNSFTLSYDTTEKKLPVDTHTLTVEFGGNGNLNGKAVTVTVTLNKAPDVTAPTGLSATYGQTLADITLPTVDNGVWSWKEDTTTQVGNVGEQTYVLVFTPDDSDFVNAAEVDVTVTVGKLELTGVTAPSNVELTAYYATAEEVKNQLPATITVTGADNKTYKLPVTWTCDPFNDQPNGESTFTWTAELGDNFAATDVATTGTIIVTNGSALSVTITGTNQETTYKGNSYNVSGMFTIDPNAGAATYAIVEGGTGAGTLEGAVLTITKAGTITIKVSTAQKLPYAAGEASATLTVNKGELSVEPLTNLTAVYGDTLSAVALPENWAWKTPETKVGDVGDRVHIAVYNTDPNLWNDKEVSLTIKVNKASIQLDASVKTFLGEVEQTTFTYGDVITVKVTPVMPMLLSAELVAPAPNQMALFYGSQQISSPVDAVNGTYTMEYATIDKVLPTGESKLTVRYVGNGNTNDASSDLPVMINPKTVTLSAVKAVSRAYDPSSLTVGIESATLEGVLNNDDVAVDTLALQATIDKADADTYTEVLLPEPIKLIGTAAQYYKATGGRIAADVTITKAALTPAGTLNLGDVMPGTPLGDVPTGPIEELFKPVEGTVTWKDPAETPVEPGKEYEWTFTPVDPNYDSVTDSVVIIPNTSFLVTVVNGTGSGEYKEGDIVNITANAPAVGKQFAGWTSNEVTFVNANAITTSFTMPAKVVTVVANYIDVPVSVHYTVVYNANGGTGVMANQYFNSGETKALLPNVFTREGYTFKGWNTKADGTGTAYVDGQVVTMYSAAILYAQWMPVEAPVVPTPTPTPTPDPVVIPLEITQQPTDQMVAPGEKAQFSIVANGDGVTYQWYINRNDGRGWVKLQGATNAVHEISAADLAYDGFQYACEVRDIHGNVVHSQVAVLYVAATPEIPETGDATNLPMLSAMLLLSFAGCLLLVNRKRMAN